MATNNFKVVTALFTWMPEIYKELTLSVGHLSPFTRKPPANSQWAHSMSEI